MKKFLLLPFMLITLCSFSQRKNLKILSIFPSPFQFTETDTTQATKDQLFMNAYEWMAKAFVHPDERIQMHEKEAGKLIGVGRLEIPIMDSSDGSTFIVGKDYIYYTMVIEIETGKYRCTLSNFIHSDRIHTSEDYRTFRGYGSLDQQTVFGPYGGNRDEDWAGIKKSVMNKSKDVLKVLQDAMNRTN